MIRINLLSEGRRPVAAKPAQPTGPSAPGEALGKWLLIGLTLIGLAIGLGHVFYIKGKVAARKTEIARARAEVKELEPVIREVEEYKARKRELQRRVQVINDLKTNQRGPVRIMDLISAALPDLLWLNRMEVGHRRITLVGEAFNTNAIANFIENLDKVPEFREPVLRDATQQRQVYSFVIIFDYSYVRPEKLEPVTAEVGG